MTKKRKNKNKKDREKERWGERKQGKKEGMKKDEISHYPIIHQISHCPSIPLSILKKRERDSATDVWNVHDWQVQPTSLQRRDN